LIFSAQLLLGASFYDPKAMDVWSVGCILAEMVGECHPLFACVSNSEFVTLMLMFRVLGTPDEVFCCYIFLWFHALTMCTSSDLLARRHQAPALQPRVPVVEAAPRACRARAGWLRGAAGRADRGVGVHVWGRGRAAAVPPALPPVPRHAAPQSRSPSVGVGDAVAVLGIQFVCYVRCCLGR